MIVLTNKKILGWGCIALSLFLSCGHKDIFTSPDPITTNQQSPTDPGQDRVGQAGLASTYTLRL